MICSFSCLRRRTGRAKGFFWVEWASSVAHFGWPRPTAHAIPQSEVTLAQLGREKKTIKGSKRCHLNRTNQPEKVGRLETKSQEAYDRAQPFYPFRALQPHRSLFLLRDKLETDILQKITVDNKLPLRSFHVTVTHTPWQRVFIFIYLFIFFLL